MKKTKSIGSKNLYESSELEHLRDLLSDFSVPRKLTPEEALRLSHIQYRLISKEVFADLLEVLKAYKKEFPAFFFGQAIIFHLAIFNGIFSNAGEFRKPTDSQGGLVHFGPFDRKSGKSAKFQGSSPKDIERDLKEICQLLSPDDPDPALSAVRFYQRFVYIHPFYDANGRIGRLLVSLYLGYHGYTVLWKPLEEEKKDKFISLLNKCHDLMRKPHYEKKVQQLYRFLKKYIISNEELASDIFE